MGHPALISRLSKSKNPLLLRQRHQVALRRYTGDFRRKTGAPKASVEENRRWVSSEAGEMRHEQSLKPSCVHIHSTIANMPSPKVNLRVLRLHKTLNTLEILKGWTRRWLGAY
jgi:hypothetical protein